MALNSLQKFLLCEVAPNFVFGCTWAILPPTKVKEYKDDIAKFKQELGDKVRVFSNNDRVLVDFAPDVFFENWRIIGAEPEFKAVNIQEDINLFNKNRTRAIEAFKKHIVKTMGKTKRVYSEQIGVYCVNETNSIQYTNPTTNRLSGCPAFRMTPSDIATVCRSLNIEVTNYKIITIAPSSTAVIMWVEYRN